MALQAQGAYLIVNADDYGYFRCVSKGILRAAAEGIVTATGVLSNATDFAEHAARLRECDALDVGVHLNLTDGVPLTAKLRNGLSRGTGRFPGKFRMAGAILAGIVKTEDVQHFAEHVIAERGVRHGRIVLVPTDLLIKPHTHADGTTHEHPHAHPQPAKRRRGAA